MTTKKTTTAPAASVTEPKSDGFKVKAGGKKGEAIVALLQAEPALSRAALAEKAGATVGRVGEVVRYLSANGTDEQKAAIARHVEAQATKKAAPKTADAPKEPAKASAKPRTRKAAGSKAAAK